MKTNRVKSYSKIATASALIAGIVAATAYGAVSSKGPAPNSSAPIAAPPGITLQPLGLSQGYSMSTRSATLLPHEELAYADVRGMTLYTSANDLVGKSMCTGECARTWIPTLAGDNAQPIGNWSIITRDDGTKQWALGGKPVYTFIKDVDPGSIGGNSPKTTGRGPLVSQRGHLIGNPPPDVPLPAGWSAALAYPVNGMELPSNFSVRLVEDAIGLVLADHLGRTVYSYQGDVRDIEKACVSESCRQRWQPVVAPQIVRPAANFGVITRSDGISQWTYLGKALYTFVDDTLPRMANGLGVDPNWQPAYILRFPVPAAVTVQTSHKLGRVWATMEGKTLYKRQGYIFQSGSGHNLRHGDTVRPAVGRDLGTEARCARDCDKWHPFPAPADAQPQGYWDVYTRSDGSKQWAYMGYAMWTFDGDEKPGDIKGNDSYDITLAHDNKTLIDIGTPYDWPAALLWIIAYP